MELLQLQQFRGIELPAKLELQCGTTLLADVIAVTPLHLLALPQLISQSS
jgi:hypothetical protein